jgi:hypothetical protein
MQAEIDIDYDQLVRLVKQLPKNQWTKLKTEVEAQEHANPSSDMLSFLMNAPTFNKKQLDEIAKARKEISQWRAK